MKPCRCPFLGSPGGNTSHCARCHCTFAGVTAFDKHQRLSERTGLHCKDPVSAGLVQREDGRWGFPPDDNNPNPFK